MLMVYFLMESKILFLLEEVIIFFFSNLVLVFVMCMGKVVYLMYLFYYEFEIVLCCLNEVLFIMVQFLLDVFFRNLEIGKLKENFVFIFDNGFVEQLLSFVVQMCLVRFFNFLNLDKVI